ncbi:MAG: T9SS C-terminal target domain-containing protein [Bacteroidetes bacterium]|nr:MAG: T9SS C-terminal target domain-containing protein [Bacteroidota bacterium]
MKSAFLSLLLFTALTSFAQNNYYYPPLSGSAWETLAPHTLGWGQARVDSLIDFAGRRNTKALLVLHKGKMVIEQYYGTHTRESLWYWASAGKSLTAFLVGAAQEDGLLDIQDTTSKYLGTGWTSAPAEKERLITLWHQLTMTSGLNELVPDDNCLSDTCLTYLADAGTRWAYYNAPYHLLHPVLEMASGESLNAYTTNRVGSRIGMGGFWLDHVRYGRARDMARFGLLALSKGIWGTDTLMRDAAYFDDMVHPSQSLNPAYGYLWWLNGSSFFKQPGLQLNFPGEIIPPAPDDMYAALGKNDQKIYVVPSLDLVIVRQGDAADNAVLALSGFDSDLWTYIMALYNSATPVEPEPLSGIRLFPNPASEQLFVEGLAPGATLQLLDLHGRKVSTDISGNVLSLKPLSPGLYLLEVKAGDKRSVYKVVKEE